MLYLIQMTTGIFGFYAHGRLTAPGDAVQTAKNILDSPTLFRLGTVADVLTALVVVILTWCLYVVLKEVDKDLALLAVFLRLVENAVAAGGIFTDFLALRLLRDTMYLQGFDGRQLQVLARLLVGGQGLSLQIAFVFLGSGTAVFACLWWRSRYIPRALAAVGILGASLLAVATVAIMIVPDLGVIGLSYMMPLGVFEISVGFWLLIKGIARKE